MNTREFIDTCRCISALDFSPSVADRAEEGVAGEMTLRYAMPYPAGIGRAVDPDPRSTRNRRGQWHELVQHLTDLAYLTPARYREWHTLRVADQPPSPLLLGAVLTAVGQFVAEDDPTAYRMTEDFPPIQREAQLHWVERYLPVLVYRAAMYTSFDGELDVRTDYRVGEESAYGRSLAFRIRVYFHDYIDRHTERRVAYFGEALLPFLYSLDNSLKGNYREILPQSGASSLHTSLQLLLLNAQHLFDAFRESHRFMDSSAKRYFLVYDLEEEEELPTPGKPDDLGEARRADRLRRRAGRKLQQDEVHIDTGPNRLGVRLLQLGLWRAGFYTGVLDGAFGPLSHAALVGLIAQEREATDPVLRPRQLDRLLIRGAGGEAYVVDLKLFARLLGAYAPPTEEVAREEEDAVWAHIADAGQEARLDEEFSARGTTFREAYGAQQRYPNRRVYYGLRGLIRGAFRAIGRVLRWIAGVVESILGAVFDFVKAVIKRIQEGIGLFFEGFRFLAHYLLGRPFVSLGEAADGRMPVVLTRFALDFDAVSLSDRGASAGDVREHLSYLRRMGAGVSYFMEVATAAVGVIAGLSTPVGWLRLGVLIGRWVRGWLSGQGGREVLA